ncbi:MAG: hypothetical protein MJ182_05620 [Treponema sp.]|nr:hypothetical protein [Treponema sp.]
MWKFNKKIFLYFISCFLFHSLFSLQLGDGTNKDSYEFIKVAENIKTANASALICTYAITNDNILLGTGTDIYIGNYMNKEIHSFEILMEDVSFCDGYYLIKNDGTLWQLLPYMKKICSNVKKVSSGLILKDDNSLWAYGNDYYGSFGTGLESTSFSVPRKIRDNIKDIFSNSIYSAIVTTKGDLLVSGSHYLPAPYKTSTSFFKVAENVKSCTEGFYITEDDTLYAFGFNGYGALGTGKTDGSNILPTKIMTNIKMVSSSCYCSLIITNDNKLYGCGGKSKKVYFGQLGLGHTDPVLTPTFIMDDVIFASTGGSSSAIIKSDGSLWTCGANSARGIGL